MQHWDSPVTDGGTDPQSRPPAASPPAVRPSTPGGPQYYASPAPGPYPAAPYAGQRPTHPPYPQPYQQRPPRQPAGVGLPRPVAVEPVPGTPFGVAVVEVAPTTSGPAAASLVAGVASILISLVVGCFGSLGAGDGWGPTVAGAFAVLAAFLGIAGLALGRAGLRQIRRTAGWGAITGRGLAIGGAICALVGLILTAIAMGASFALLPA